MRYLAVLLIYGGGAVLSMQGIVYAACLFLWSDIFQPLSFAKNRGALPVAQYVVAVLLLSYVVGYLRGKITPYFGTYFFLLIGLMVWIAICSGVSHYPDTAWPFFVVILKYVLPLAFIHTALKNRMELKILAGCLAISVGVWAAQAGAHCLVNGVNTDLGIEGGQMTDRNDFAAAIVGTLPVLLYFVFTKEMKYKWILKPPLLIMTFLGLMAIFFSLSRGASIGLGAMVMLYVSYVSKKKIRDALVVVMALVALFFTLPKDYFDRMHTIKLDGEQTEGSAVARVNLLQGALKASLDYPIFGLGPSCWLEVAEAYTGDNHNPHSIYLVLSTEIGMVGLLFYLIMMGYTFVQLSQTINHAHRRGDLETSRLGQALLMSIFGLLAAMSFLNRPFNEYLWAWISIANALPIIYRRELAQNRGGAMAKNRGRALRRVFPRVIPPSAPPLTSET
jgi:probable O-glycosylation ligase (exosortase A-associated)